MVAAPSVSDPVRYDRSPASAQINRALTPDNLLPRDPLSSPKNTVCTIEWRMSPLSISIFQRLNGNTRFDAFNSRTHTYTVLYII